MDQNQMSQIEEFVELDQSTMRCLKALDTTDQNFSKTKREALDKIFLEICPNVYYQPPAGHQMKYPAIRYRRSAIENSSADNIPYILDTAYEVTVIDRDPDSIIVDKISKLPKCRHSSHYTSANLNHDRFIIYA